MNHAPAILTRTVCTRKALRCLNTIADSGASDAAISETRRFISALGTSPQTYARSTSALLDGVLSYLDSGSEDRKSALPGGFPGIPLDLMHRAAAACCERDRMKPGEIVLSFAGDCMFGAVNGDSSAVRFPSIYRKSGRPDYPFALVRPWFENDDLTVVNYEGTLTKADRTADKQWKFKGAHEYAAILPAGSVEVAGLSNNHSFDYLDRGFRDTVAAFHDAHVGVFYQNSPLITRLKGVETILIGDCSVVGENTTVTDGVAERVLEQIRRFKRADNIVIVVMHWGSELDTVPTRWQQETGRKFIDAGADAVIGAHPHVLQGMESYKGKPIAYSLGNFAFGGNFLARYPETIVLRLQFPVSSGRIGPAHTSIVPCHITSSKERNESGVVRNNYQPTPLFGKEADQTADLLLERSAVLQHGVSRIHYFNPR